MKSRPELSLPRSRQKDRAAAIARLQHELRMMKASLLPMAIYLCGVTLLFHFDRLFVRNFMLAESAGYGAVTTLGSIPWWFISAVVFVIFPLASAEHAEGKDIRRFYVQALAIGAGITVLCGLAFFLLSASLFSAWNPAFAPYARYVWVYGVATGLHGCIQIIASVEIAQHRYRFLWLLVMPTLAMCVILYSRRTTLSVAEVITVMISARAVILVGMVALGLISRRRAA